MTQAKGSDIDPSHRSARCFRVALEAMARPGSILAIDCPIPPLPPLPVSRAAGALILTLADQTTPVHLAGAHDCAAVQDWILFHTGAPLAAAAEAQFAIGPWQALLPLEAFAQGSAEFPDRSATLIVECAALSASGAILRGPGIRDQSCLSLPETAAFAANRARFPLGLDFFFTAGDRLAALPRSIEVEAA